MNKRIDFTKQDGLATYQDTLDFLQTSYRGNLEAISRGFGDKLILHGVVEAGGNVTDGWVIIDGQMMPFVGGSIYPKVVVEELSDVELFGDSSIKTVYLTKRARLAVVGDFDYTELKRFKTDSLTVDSSDVLASAKAVKKLNDNILAALSFETRIILKGCEVSNVNTGASTLDIAAGVVLMDNVFVESPVYSGAYPVWLKPDATYVVADPGGTNVKFDPYTSQRYADVLKRTTTSVGEIKMFKTLSDRFDAVGIGKWEMTGFKICDDMQGRVPLGYDRRLVDPVDGIWDANYNGVWNTGGEKAHTLTINELPTFAIETPKKKPDIDRGVSGASSTWSIDEIDINNIGNNQPHNNIPPYRVVLFLERI